VIRHIPPSNSAGAVSKRFQIVPEGLARARARARTCSRPFSSGMFLITRAASQREDQGRCLCCENELFSADESRRRSRASRLFSIFYRTSGDPRRCCLLKDFRQDRPDLDRPLDEPAKNRRRESGSFLNCLFPATNQGAVPRTESPLVVSRITMDYRVGVIRPQRFRALKGIAERHRDETNGSES